MLKSLSNEAAAQKAPQAYPLGYVEDAFKPRTKLEGFFSILDRRVQTVSKGEASP